MKLSLKELNRIQSRNFPGASTKFCRFPGSQRVVDTRYYIIERTHTYIGHTIQSTWPRQLIQSLCELTKMLHLCSSVSQICTPTSQLRNDSIALRRVETHVSATLRRIHFPIRHIHMSRGNQSEANQLTINNTVLCTSYNI